MYVSVVLLICHSLEYFVLYVKNTDYWIGSLDCLHGPDLYGLKTCMGWYQFIPLYLLSSFSSFNAYLLSFCSYLPSLLTTAWYIARHHIVMVHYQVISYSINQYRMSYRIILTSSHIVSRRYCTVTVVASIVLSCHVPYHSHIMP